MSTECPSQDVLIGFVSGDLAEDAAHSLIEHVSTCSRCRKVIDGVAREGDSLVGKLRHTKPSAPPVIGSSMDRLIANAGLLVAEKPIATPPRESKASPAGPVAFDVFINELSGSGLLDHQDVQQALSSIESRDVQSFALELVNQGKLTRYQAGLLARGKSRGLVLGNYVVLDKLGQGGMGLVFKAKHKRMGRVVAIKILPSAATKSPDSVRRFHREMETAAKLIHENIVVAHDADESDGIHFLVMEYIDGSDLSRIVRRKGALSVDQAVSCILQAARGLAHAHRLGIVHRDIKPQNLLLDSQGTVKVLDMGLARLDAAVTDSLSRSDLTNSGIVMGTVDYMAPEQALNSKNADHRSDVYSLGCTLHFLLTGKAAYRGETVMEKLVAHREHPVPQLSKTRRDIPHHIESIFERMVAKDPSNRYQSMDELVTALESVASGDIEDLQPIVSVEEIEAYAETIVSFTGEDTVPSKVPPLSDALSEFEMAESLSGTVTMPMPASSPFLLPTSTPKKFPINRRHLWIGGGMAAGLVLLAVGLVVGKQVLSYASNSDLIATTFGGDPVLLSEGGSGRVLLIVPQNKPWYPDYESVRKAFENRGVEIRVATGDGGYAKAENGIKVPADIALAKAKPSNFDAVVICGAHDVSEFKPNEKNGKLVSQFVKKMNDSDRVVAAICKGQYALGWNGFLKNGSYAESGYCSYGEEKPFQAKAKCQGLVNFNNIVLGRAAEDAEKLAEKVYNQAKAKSAS